MEWPYFLPGTFWYLPKGQDAGPSLFLSILLPLPLVFRWGLMAVAVTEPRWFQQELGDGRCCLLFPRTTTTSTLVQTQGLTSFEKGRWPMLVSSFLFGADWSHQKRMPLASSVACSLLLIPSLCQKLKSLFTGWGDVFFSWMSSRTTSWVSLEDKIQMFP